MAKRKTKKEEPNPIAIHLNDGYDYSKCVIEYKFSDSSAFKLTKELIKGIYNKAKDAEKVPFIIISIPNDEKTNFVLHCSISTKRKA